MDENKLKRDRGWPLLRKVNLLLILVQEKLLNQSQSNWRSAKLLIPIMPKTCQNFKQSFNTYLRGSWEIFLTQSCLQVGLPSRLAHQWPYTCLKSALPWRSKWEFSVAMGSLFSGERRRDWTVEAAQSDRRRVGGREGRNGRTGQQHDRWSATGQHPEDVGQDEAGGEYLSYDEDGFSLLKDTTSLLCQDCQISFNIDRKEHYKKVCHFGKQNNKATCCNDILTYPNLTGPIHILAKCPKVPFITFWLIVVGEPVLSQMRLAQLTFLVSF